MSHNQPEQKSHRKRNIGIVIILVFIVWGIYSVQHLTSPSISTSTTSPQPLPYFNVTSNSTCLIHYVTNGTSVYLIRINVTNGLNVPITYQNVSVKIASVSLSNGNVTFPAFVERLPQSWWTTQGANLSLRLYLPVNASIFHYPHDEVTGATLTVYVTATESNGQPEQYTVSPYLFLSFTDVPVCTDASS